VTATPGNGQAKDLIDSTDSRILNVHAIMPASRVNGPGLRTVVWVQGCSRCCPGCFNPETHDRGPRTLIPAIELVRLVEQIQPQCEGITVSGGEPLEQAAALLSFVRHIRSRTHLSMVLFSGYSLHEIRHIPEGPDILAHVDVLIAGSFMQEQRLAGGLLGSSNQEIHVLSDRYRLVDLVHAPSAEIIIDAQGQVKVSGLDPPRLS